MKTDFLVQLGQIAGIGGIALGVLLIVFREVLRKNIFPQMPKAHAYKIIRLIIVLTFSIAAMGIIAWTYVQTGGVTPGEPSFPKTDAEPAINQYLSLIDAYQFSEAWNIMADFAHSRYQFESFQKAYEAQRRPLGAVVSRVISASAPVKQLQDGTQGAFTITTYITKYQNGNGPYLEQVAAIAEDSVWKVFAHTTVPCPEKACQEPIPTAAPSQAHP